MIDAKTTNLNRRQVVVGLSVLAATSATVGLGGETIIRPKQVWDEWSRCHQKTGASYDVIQSNYEASLRGKTIRILCDKESLGTSGWWQMCGYTPWHVCSHYGVLQGLWLNPVTISHGGRVVHFDRYEDALMLPKAWTPDIAGERDYSA